MGLMSSQFDAIYNELYELGYIDSLDNIMDSDLRKMISDNVIDRYGSNRLDIEDVVYDVVKDIVYSILITSIKNNINFQVNSLVKYPFSVN
jgi:hypothetical protein